MSVERSFLLHALSPLHPGTGQSADVIDLPIARMQSTGIPILPGTSIKGTLRHDTKDQLDDEDLHRAIFGPGEDNASDHAGALTATDARLLALPIRSFKGTFTWATSPLLLRFAERDLEADLPEVPNDFDGRGARVLENNTNVRNGRIYLEELDLETETTKGALEEWAEHLGDLVSPDHSELFEERLALVDDETMTFLWETATQVDTRIRLDDETRTVEQGALWAEESLPPETLMLGLLSATGSRYHKVDKTAEEILDEVFDSTEHLQFGGHATVGRGRSRMVPVDEA